MPEYVSPEIEQDPTAIQKQMIDDLESSLPGLEVRPATVLFYLITVFAFLWARLAEQSSQVFATIFRYYGTKIVRIPPATAVAAVTTVTFTAADTDGPYTIPAGTEINLRGPDGTPVAFRTTSLATIPNGTTSVTPVTVVAATPGTGGNGLSVFHSVSQTLTFLDSVTVLAATGGGEDAETDDQYQNRLADLLSLPARTLAHPTNFETWARNQPGVDRALALNNYTPGPPASSSAPGHITVFVTDNTGGPLTTPEKTALQAAVRTITLNNLISHIADPTYTVVDVEFEGVATPGSDPAIVQAQAEAAVLRFLDPALWALPPQGDVRGWEDRQIVYHQDVSHVLNSVEGFDHWTTLTINGAASDLTLTGPAALPDPASTATGTVTAP